MMQLGRVLVIDGSQVMRETMRTVLRRHARGVLVAERASEARSLLERYDDLDLVLAEVELPDGDAFGLLEQDARARLGQRRWLLIARHPSPRGKARAGRLGASGYLAKPVAFRDIASCLSGVPAKRRRGPRAELGPRVWLVDGASGGERLLTWTVEDFSAEGAFLVTPGPVAVGTRLRLDLGIAEEVIQLTATVVRVQEPGWGRSGGLGVRFEEPGSAVRDLVNRQVRGRRLGRG